MSDVPVDPDLKSRVLESFALAAEEPASTRPSASRRAATVAILAGTLAGVALWLFPPDEQLAFADIRSQVPALWRSADLPDMSTADAPPLPDGGWLSSKVAFDAAIGRFSLDDNEHHAIAVRRFSIRGRHGETASGMLLAISADVIRPGDRPANSDFFGGLKDSIVLDEGTLALVSWSQRDTVYVCLIPSGPAEAALQDALRIDFS